MEKSKYVMISAIEKWVQKKIEERGGLDGTSPLSRAGEMALLGELSGFLYKYSEEALDIQTKESVVSELYKEKAIRATPRPDDSTLGFIRGINKALYIITGKEC